MMTLSEVTSPRASEQLCQRVESLSNTQYLNIPQSQQNVQRLVDQFNQDEAFWRGLEPHRRMRRKMLCRLWKKRHRALDLLEFAALRPSDDCVGVRLGN